MSIQTRNIPGVTYKRDADYSEVNAPAYRVIYKGEDIGGLCRVPRVSAGYWGSWTTTGAGRGEVGDSRNDVTLALIRRASRRAQAQA